MIAEGAYKLPRGFIPEPPQSTQWRELLRWCVAVMDGDDPDLPFIASLLSHCLNRGGITEKQARYGERIIERVQRSWEKGLLAMQNGVST